MKTTEILIQGESIPDIQLVSIAGKATVARLLSEAAKQCEIAKADDALLFLEDEDEPLDRTSALPANAAGQPHRVHIHRCRKVLVTVTYNGRALEEKLSPALTVARVKRQFARLFGLEPKDAAEHVLQISGTTERPEPDTQIGALTRKGVCAVSFDLVPLVRVEG